MDFDDLDQLLDLEEDLLFEDDDTGGKKRSFQDAASSQEAAKSLGVGMASKRTRTAPQPALGGTSAVEDFDDDELLQLARQEPQQQRQQPGVGFMSNTEEQECRRLAAWPSLPGSSSQQQQEGGSLRRGSGPATSFDTLPESERLALLAVARGGPASQSEDAVPDSGPSSMGRAGLQPPGSEHQLWLGSEPLDKELAELLHEDDGSGSGGPAAAPHPPPGRQQAQRGGGAGSGIGAASGGDYDVIPRRQLLPPMRDVMDIPGDFVTVTSESGERVYCTLEDARPGRGSARQVDVAAALRRYRGRLLSEGIDSLMGQVDQDNYHRALAETEAEAAATAAGTIGAPAAAAAAAASPSGNGVRGEQAGKGGGALWVQKYAPKTFWDLLSDEQTNREVVRWLKGWDPCVFGRPAPAAPQAAPGAGAKGRGGGFKGFGAAAAQDPLGRPEHKVILLAGPPGLGKTTLAHVVARHCGYRAVEINASDDRSGAALAARVLDAVEMRAVMGERRPNCVIVDEIDGATGGAEGRSAIAALLKIVNAAPAKGGGKKGGRGAGAPAGSKDGGGASPGGDSDSEAEGEEEKGAAEGGSRGGGGSGRRAGRGAGATQARAGGGVRCQPLRPLLRPIICVCNDLYAPALRPLREVAKVFHFRKPQAERLAQRLQVVCGWEGLAADKSALRGLAERTDCDIRACLNTLQFVAKRCGGGAVRGSDLASVQVGQKDMTKGAFAVWQDLLQKKMQRVGVGSRMESDAERHARIFNTLMDFGEHDLVISGLHENVLHLRYMDVGLGRTSTLLAHLADADRLLHCCHRAGDFGLLKYVPASLVAVSGLVAGHERPQLQWPKAGADARRRGAANRALLQGWLLGVDPHVYAATGPQAMVQEVLPSLLHISAPPLRPVSRHLYSPEEQLALVGVVGALLAYGLRFAQEGEDEDEDVDLAGQRELALRGVRAAKPQEAPMRFRPHVHRLSMFPGVAPGGRRLAMAIRQLVSHEADLEAIRRAEAVRHGGAGGSPGARREHGAGAPAPVPGAAGRTIATLAERMRGAQQQQPAAKKASAVTRGTWLDQLKEQRMQRRPAGAAAALGSSQRASPSKKLPVLYKYHEGYTNAVKRPLKMCELL